MKSNAHIAFIGPVKVLEQFGLKLPANFDLNSYDFYYWENTFQFNFHTLI